MYKTLKILAKTPDFRTINSSPWKINSRWKIENFEFPLGACLRRCEPFCFREYKFMTPKLCFTNGMVFLFRRTACQPRKHPPKRFFLGGAKTSQISSWFGRQASYSSSGIVTKSHKMKRLPRNDQSNWITFRGPKTHRWKTEGSFKISFILKVELLALILKKNWSFSREWDRKGMKGLYKYTYPNSIHQEDFAEVFSVKKDRNHHPW